MKTEEDLRADLQPLDGFREDVQALRGLAVLAVVLYHAGGILPGGYVGVDVFFVISGFVIGRVLLSELVRTGRISLVGFYVRRAGRLLPALSLMLTVVILAMPLVGPIGAQAVTVRTALANVLFLANGYLFKATERGYFDTGAERNPLLHTWSLSVEEQFYFVLPPLLLMLWLSVQGSQGPVHRLRRAVGAVALLSLVAGVSLTFATGADGSWLRRLAFYAPVTRAWEFLAGVGLVLLPRRVVAQSVGVRWVLISGGVGLILWSAVGFSNVTPFPGVAALVPVAGVLLVLLGGQASEPERSIRRRGLLWQLGDVSYGWYLWHWPFIVFARAVWPSSGPLIPFLAAVASLVPAWASYRWVEAGLRSQLFRSPRGAVVAAGCFGALPLAAILAHSPINRAVAERVRSVDLSASLAPYAGYGGRCDASLALGARERQDCVLGGMEGGARLVLAGDSNAAQFGDMILGLANAKGLRVELATRSGCPFVDGDIQASFGDAAACRDFVEQSLRDMESHPRDLVVIGVATDQYVGTGNRQTAYESALHRTIRRLEAAGSRVVILAVVPKPGWGGDRDPRRCAHLTLLRDLSACGFPPFALHALEVHERATGAERAAVRGTQAVIWDFAGYLCPDETCSATQGGALVWRDGDHVSAATSRRLVPHAAEFYSALDPQA